MTKPPPQPVPIIIPKTELAPLAAPSFASDRTKQSASLAIFTGQLSEFSRSCWKGWPIKQVVLAFFTKPLVGLMAPGMPMPMC